MYRYALSGSSIDSATLEPSDRLRAFTRPFAVLTRTTPLVKSNHTGVTCGEPSGCSVAMCANAFFSVSRSRNCAGMSAMVLVLVVRRFYVGTNPGFGKLGFGLSQRAP